MKLSLFLVLIISVVVAHLTLVAAEATNVHCPFASTDIYVLGAELVVQFNPAKCNNETIRPAMTKFLEAHVTQLFGMTKGGSVELDFPQVCEKAGGDDDGKGNNLRHNRRLQWDFSYNILGRKCICAHDSPRNPHAQPLLDHTLPS